MADSDRPSKETKAQIVARHQAELQDSGHGIGLIRKWGGAAGAVMAIGALLAAIGTQFWPWCVKIGMTEEQKSLPATVTTLNASMADATARLEAIIKAAGEHMHENDLRAQRLHDSVGALRNEVRLRHGGTVSASLFGATSGSGGGSSGRAAAPARRAPAAARPRPMTRRQQIQAVVKDSDQKLSKAKAAPERKFQDRVNAQLKK